MLNRTFTFRSDEGAITGEILVHVYDDADPPHVHVAYRKERHHTWGPPMPEVSNQDEPS